MNNFINAMHANFSFMISSAIINRLCCHGLLGTHAVYRISNIFSQPKATFYHTVIIAKVLAKTCISSFIGS